MFITLEGPEGSGKSTQALMLAQFLSDNGFSVVTTREPGGTSIGYQIRGVLHDVANEEMESETEFLLYSASRAQLVREVIRPALLESKVVLCDRYADSSIAYQGYGRGLDLETLLAVTEFATGGLVPDLTLLLDIDVEQGLSRRIDGDEEMNRLDLQEIAFHQRVREGYHQLAAAGPERWVLVDAGRRPEEIQRDLRRIVLERLGESVG
ncbi:MAG: dTMP kinase [Candidatus Promineifilaceae bacterium]|jgi:dTMP kinase